MILRLRAPFAAFRPFQAGAYRSTARVMPPSAAYGVVLNLAGIDARDPSSPGATRFRADAPTLRIAVGLSREPGVALLLQQAHSYPVGNSGKDLAARTHGAKYWIAPVRREVLVDFDGAIAFESEGGVVERLVAETLNGSATKARYGLPFAGDNNFLFDRIDLVEGEAVRWFERFSGEGRPRPGSTRLPVRIDRDDQSRTEIALFAPCESLSPTPATASWVMVGP